MRHDYKETPAWPLVLIVLVLIAAMLYGFWYMWSKGMFEPAPEPEPVIPEHFHQLGPIPPHDHEHIHESPGSNIDMIAGTNKAVWIQGLTAGKGADGRKEFIDLGLKDDGTVTWRVRK